MWNLLFLSGFSLISYGCYLINPGFGFIVGGFSLLIISGIMLAGKISKKVEQTNQVDLSALKTLQEEAVARAKQRNVN